MSTVATPPPIDTDDDLIRAIRGAIQSERERLGFDTDEQLADHYGITRKTLIQWKYGRIKRGTRALLRVVLNGLIRA